MGKRRVLSLAYSLELLAELGVMPQKIVLFVATAGRASNSTLYLIL
jgi:hypothetical protein